MADNYTHIIKANKQKTFINLFLLIIGLAVTLLMAIYPEFFISTRFRNKYLIGLTGLIGFLYCFCLLVSKLLFLLKTKNAIQVQYDCFIDNSSYESIGRINWVDVKSINLVKTKFGSKYIKVDVDSDFLNRKFKNSNLFTKVLVIMKNWEYKLSVIIFSNSLEGDISELYEIMTDKFYLFNNQRK